MDTLLVAGIAMNADEKRDDNMDVNEEKYEEIICKLCEILKILDKADFQKIMGENEELQNLYCTINDTTCRFEQLTREGKREQTNKEIIQKCRDIEYQFSTKYVNMRLMGELIKDYRQTNHLNYSDTTQNLIKAINVEASELLELYNFQDEDAKVCREDILDELGDVLIYCFALATSIPMPVDRIIARKIRKNIGRDREYDN